MSSLVSVIVPIYQVRDYLAQCLRSLQNQDYRNLEILLIDDCSTDGSLQIAEDFASQDSRISIIRNPQNLGLGASRNVGLRQAKGEYVLFLDSDDEFSSSQAISHCVKYADKYELEVFCFGYYMAKYDELETTCIYREKYIHNNFGYDYGAVFAGGNNIMELFYWNTFFAVWMRLYRRSFLEQHNIRFVEGLRYEDVPFTAQVLVFGKRIMVSKRCLIYYRLRSSKDNISITQNSYNLDILEVFEQVYNFLCSQGLYNIKLGYAFMWAVYLNIVLSMLSVKSEILVEYYAKLRALVLRIYNEYPFLPYHELVEMYDVNLYHKRELIILMQDFYKVILEKESVLDALNSMIRVSIGQIERLCNPKIIFNNFFNTFKIFTKKTPFKYFVYYPYLFAKLVFRTSKRIF